MSKKLMNTKIKNEKDLIYLLLNHKSAVEQFINSSLTPEHFDEDFRFIISSIIETYDMYDVILTRRSFLDKVKSFRSPKDRTAQELAFQSCCVSNVTLNDLPHLISTIVEGYIDHTIFKALEDFREQRKRDGVITSIKNLSDVCDSLLAGNQIGEKTYYQDIRSLSKSQCQYLIDVIEGNIEEKPPILTGIREVDYTMATGLEAGTLTLFCADVAGFKSTTMLNVGMNVWEQGHDVLFVPLEMHRNQMWRRAMARDARINSKFLTQNIKDNLTKEDINKIKEINAMWEKRDAKFFIMQEPGNTTVNKIEKQILRNIDIIQPKLVVIDYVANLEAHKNRYGRNDLEIGDMLKKMRQMGKDNDFAIISGAQLGREALKRIRKDGANKDKPAINSEDIRGSHEYSADADNIYAQLRSASQPNQLLDLYCVKSRNGSTTFEDDNVKAVLEVYPQYGLIKSSPLEGEASEVDDIMVDYVDATEADSTIISKGSKMFADDDNDNDVFDDISQEVDDVEDVSDILKTMGDDF
jgi:KaiC/GvpD/RAD55 family RecA-like ATPase